MTIFLYIDGVLIPNSKKKIELAKDGFSEFTKNPVDIINSLPKKINWVVCPEFNIWGIDNYNKLFQRRNCNINIVGMTPPYEDVSLFYKIDPFALTNGHDIELYCKNNSIYDYLIISPTNDFFDYQLPYLIQTNPARGLVDYDLESILLLL